MSHLIKASGGHLVFATGGHLVKEIEPVPSACPEWPPSSILAENYDIRWTGTVDGSPCVALFGPGGVYESPTTVPYTPSVSCKWNTGGAQRILIYHDSDGSGGYRWEAHFDTGFADTTHHVDAVKLTGNTPVGSYTVISRDGPCSINTVDNIEVSAAAP